MFHSQMVLRSHLGLFFHHSGLYHSDLHGLCGLCSTGLGSQGLCGPGVPLTYSIEEPLGFVLPPDSDGVDWQTCSNDPKTNGTFYRSFPEGHDDEEQTGQDEGDGQGHVHLRGRKERVSGRSLRKEDKWEEPVE